MAPIDVTATVEGYFESVRKGEQGFIDAGRSLRILHHHVRTSGTDVVISYQPSVDQKLGSWLRTEEAIILQRDRAKKKVPIKSLQQLYNVRKRRRWR